MRETLYDEIPPTRRARLHLRIGAALETLHGRDPMSSLAALAHHYCAALPGGDPRKAADYAQRAAERADQLFAYEEAARYCRLALQALEAKGASDDPARRCRLLIALGQALVKTGENLQAADVLQHAAASAKALGVSEEFARAALAFEEATWRPGIPGDAAARLLRDALAGLGEEDSILRARVLSSLTRALVFSGALDDAHAVHAEALAMARRLGDAATIAAALRSVATARWLPQQFAARMRVAREAEHLAETIGDRERVLEAASWRLFDLMELGDLPARAHEFEAYMKLADEVRQPFYQYIGVSSRAMMALFEGRLDESERLAREALELGGRMPGLDAEGVYGMQMFSVRREQGRLRELAPMVAHFVQHTAAAATWRPGLAVVYSELGLAAEARAEFEAVLANGLDSVPKDARWVTCMTYLAEVCAFLGDAERAAALYAELRAVRGPQPHRPAEHRVLRQRFAPPRHARRRDEALAGCRAALRSRAGDERPPARAPVARPHAAPVRGDAARAQRRRRPRAGDRAPRRGAHRGTGKSGWPRSRSARPRYGKRPAVRPGGRAIRRA